MSDGIIDRRAPKVNSQLLAYLLIVVLMVTGTYVAFHNSERIGGAVAQISKQQVRIRHQQERLSRLTRQIAHQQRALRAGLVKGCRENGNPLRAVVRGQVQQQIKQSRKPSLYRTFFPSVPQHKLHLLIRASIRRDRAEIKKLAPVNCVALYH